VLCRCCGVEGFPGTPAVEKLLWQRAEALLPEADVDIYIQAQMDLGAAVCTRGRPRCAGCPLHGLCVAARDGRTGELPQARPRRALPERATTLLVLMHGGRVLLEARPPAGIWGGLLSLPELPPGSAVERYAASIGVAVAGVEPLPPRVHTFTHFRLTIHPLLVAVQPLPQAAEGGRCWLDRTALKTAPLPAPIRSLLAALSDSP